jgi:hypothetical protein
MSEEKKGMDVIAIDKGGLAALAVVEKDEPRPHFRGVLIKDNAVVGTDAKILVRVPLDELQKENVPDTIETEHDTNTIWISAETLSKAFKNIVKKPIASLMQNYVYIAKKEDVVKSQVIGDSGVITITEDGNTTKAEDFPGTDTIFSSANNPENKTYTIGGVTILKLAEIVKQLGKKGIAFELKMGKEEGMVYFTILQDHYIGKGIDGAFMLMKNRVQVKLPSTSPVNVEIDATTKETINEKERGIDK